MIRFLIIQSMKRAVRNQTYHLKKKISRLAKQAEIRERVTFTHIRAACMSSKIVSHLTFPWGQMQPIGTMSMYLLTIMTLL